MRAQGNDRAQQTDQSGRAAARTPGVGSVAPARGLMALQAAAGNAAVLQMLRQAGRLRPEEQHQPSAGCGTGHVGRNGHVEEEGQSAVQRSAVRDTLRTPGTPMDETMRSEMEARLGADFSDVRIHSDRTAKVSAAEMGARAYTFGNHVVIGDGTANKHTLAHELTHVIQQRQGPVEGADNGSGLKVSAPSDRFEREAEATAARAMSGTVPTSPSIATGVAERSNVHHAHTGVVQRIITDSQGRTISSKKRLREAVASILTHFPKEMRAQVENEIVHMADVEFEQFPLDQVPEVLRDRANLSPPTPQQLPSIPQVSSPQERPQHEEISLTSPESFLESISSIWHIQQGNTGCGLLGNVLYLSSSGPHQPAYFGEIKEAVKEIENQGSPLPAWFPRDGLVECYGYSGTSSNHAECRIIKVWGDGNGSGGIIRTTQPACKDCAHLMDEQGIRHDSVTNRKNGLTGWIHPFTMKFYGPQTTDSIRYAPS
ncbi:MULTISPECIES: DUF4157 domain-containing protein [Streptomyces]|uniref:eCIS core domain-containing protein n=1 Tax=Streptomyces TaxID=1883 RepID=UPI00093D41FB|nr:MULTISPECIES: DUF4157 domain-containing protein [unclassified Streptomyces]QNQ36036.1 DUF4157 domain-containing protein [Streptomyces sp. CB00271]